MGCKFIYVICDKSISKVQLFKSNLQPHTEIQQRGKCCSFLPFKNNNRSLFMRPVVPYLVKTKPGLFNQAWPGEKGCWVSDSSTWILYMTNKHSDNDRRYLGELSTELLRLLLCQAGGERVGRVPYGPLHRHIGQAVRVIHSQAFVRRVQVDIWNDMMDMREQETLAWEWGEAHD